MHRIHVTEGLVLAKRGAGESNTHVAILTKELGLVRASARSARLQKSKLRYGLEPLTEARFSFVRGRNEWKLTGVERIERLQPRNRARVGKVARLLLRLVHGEEISEELFSIVIEGFQTLVGLQSDVDAESLECVLVLRILSSLGYLPHTPQLARFIERHPGEQFSLELSAEVRQSRATLIRTINESLSATGL